MDALGQELIGRLVELQRTNTPGFLGMLAMLRQSSDLEGKEPPTGYSRGCFKRTIKFLRSFQQTNPEFSIQAEGAIALIRRDWLHRDGQREF